MGRSVAGNNNSRSGQAWRRCMSLANRISNMRHLKLIHALFITHGIHQNNYAISKLISFAALSPSGDFNYASLLFHQTPNPNTFIYNTLIRAHSRSSSHPHLALTYFHLMLKNHHDDTNTTTTDNNTILLLPDHHTFPFALIACANSGSVKEGKQIHCWVFKNGLAESDKHTQTALTRFYAEIGSMVDARKVFDEIPQRDVVQWNVIINGYLRLDFADEALNLFRDMLGSHVEPDEFCVATAVTACAHSGALHQGMWIHEYVKKRNGCVENDVFVGTALVDMYAKCGCIDKAVEVFEKMPKRNVFSWSVMIGGFGLHGFAREAFHCLDRMWKEDGLMPDSVVLLGALTACTHGGLEEEGWFLLKNMEAQYGVVPKHEHYSCMVDLLCRAGHLDEAVALIRRMPMRPLASVWGALLGACRYHANVELAELAVKELLELDREDASRGSEEDGAYVQLSNIYLGVNRGEDARKIRKMMGERGIKKTPGCSVVEVNGEVNEFVSGDIGHHCRLEIDAVLDLLSLQMVDHNLKKDQMIPVV